MESPAAFHDNRDTSTRRRLQSRKLQLDFNLFPHLHDLGKRLVRILAARKQNAEPAVSVEFAFAEQADRSVGHCQDGIHVSELHGPGNAVRDNRLGRARTVKRDIRDRKSEDRSCVKRELGKILRDQRHHAGVMRARADFAENHLIALDEHFHAENTASAETVRNFLRNLCAFAFAAGVIACGCHDS